MTAAVAAFDVGGTRVKAALVDADLRELTALTVPTPAQIATEPGRALRPILDRLLADAPAAQVQRAGVVAPGLIDDDLGVARLAVNLGWRGLPLRDLVTRELAIPVTVGHDVRAGLLAEARLGAAAGVDDAIFVAIGTGIAAAILTDGRVLRAHGQAGEIGHAVVVPGGAPCACGARGCLETVASAGVIGRRYAELAGAAGPVSAEQVAGLVARGDDLAQVVWREAVEALATVLGLTIAATGAQRVVIGGGLALSGDGLLQPLRAALAPRLTLGRSVEVVPALLGDRAGCLGAAALAWGTP